MSEATVRILRILLQCGMIAREEQEIVRGLIRGCAPGSVASGIGASSSASPPEPFQGSLPFDSTRPGPTA